MTNQKKKSLIFAACVFFIAAGYAYYFLQSRTFVNMTITSSHTDPFTIFWNYDEDNQNLSTYESKSIMLYPKKRHYFFWLPKDFDANNIRNLYISNLAFENRSAIFERLYFFRQGRIVIKSDLPLVFKTNFIIQDNTGRRNSVSNNHTPFKVTASRNGGVRIKIKPSLYSNL